MRSPATPDYVLQMGLLHDIVPHARIVHLVRDGRDVSLSALECERTAAQLRRRFPTCVDAPVATAALWWRWHVLQGRASGASLAPELQVAVRYEALVGDPEGECRRLCDLLGVAFGPAMPRFHEGRLRARTVRSRAGPSPVPGLRDWTTLMPLEHVEEFEAAAGDALEAFGYRRAFPTPVASRLRIAADAIAAFPERASCQSRT